MTQYRPLGTVSAPAQWTLPSSLVLELAAVRAIYDGTGATAAFLPVFDVISDAGEIVASCPALTSTAAGGSVDVSWFPWVKQSTVIKTSPTNPLGTLIAWYDFADTSTITLDGSGKIQVIADKSGNNHPASQATAARRPGQTTVNGLNAGLFNSAATTLLSTGFLSSAYTQPITICVVYTQTATGDASYWPGVLGGLNTTTLYHIYAHDADGGTRWEVGSGNTIGAGAPAPWTQRMVVALANGASSYLRVDRSQTNDTIQAQVLDSILIGSQVDGAINPGEVDYMDGAVCEVQYYSGQLSASQLAGVEAYLRAKWATP